MIAPARDAAFRVLRAVHSGRGDLGDALSRARDPLPDRRDRSLATELVTGTLRWRNALDYQLQQRSAKPLHKLDAAVLDALRLGAYQLLHLQRVPTSAVVNDSVELVKGAGVRSAAGFVNAVLRRLARERESLTWPDRHDRIEYLSVVHSHPQWLVRRWIERHGDEAAERWMRFNNAPPALTLAANRLLNTREELIGRLRDEAVESEPTRTAPHGVTVTSGHALTTDAFASGYCVVQDEASQIIPELAQVQPGATVLDLCASPGGKTLSLAAQSAPNGRVVASDVRPRRVRLLAETMVRCRSEHVDVVYVPTAGELPFQDDAFSCVLIDAPCSGLGTLRRDPDIRWRREAADLPMLSAAQLELLRRTRRIVAPGGRIIYSTCSSEPEENEDVVNSFLSESPDFSVVRLDEAGLLPAITPMMTPDGYFRSNPDHGLELFFGAILQKKSKK